MELQGRSSEREVLDRLIEAVRAGESRSLLVRGEPGVGKTALLEYVLEQTRDWRELRAAGVQSEMELAFAGLHQLVAPLLDRLERLPGPQRDALRTALGIGTGSAPNRLLVGLAVLSVLSDVAEDRPLICVVDDEQWLDRASAQVLAFVARRLDAESVGVVFAARVTSDELAGLPELVVEGLSERDAHTLLDSVLPGPLDARVRDQIVSETHGNPLALLELPRGVTPAELAGGFALPGAAPLSKSIEESFRRRLDALPAETRRLLLLAAADPVGEPLLVWRAAERLGIGAEAAAGAAEAGLLEFGARVRFRPRWCARRRTDRRRFRSDRSCTAPWRRPLMANSIQTAERGTGPTPRRVPTRTSPPSWWTSRPTRVRCSTTASVATRPRATPRGRSSSAITSGSGPISCPS